MVWALITSEPNFILKTFFAAVNKKAIKAEAKTKRMTVVKSLSFKVGIVLLSIWLFGFMIGHLEIFGVNCINFFEALAADCYPDQQTVVDASKNIVRVRLESAYAGKGARLGNRWCSKSESIPIILLVGVAVWGAAIIFVLGLILYRVVIEPLVKKKLKTE